MNSISNNMIRRASQVLRLTKPCRHSNSKTTTTILPKFNLQHIQHLRTYSTTPTLQSNFENAEALTLLLERELKEETEENHGLEMPPELAELKSDISEKWTILDGSATSTDTGSDGATVRMFRKDPLPNGSKVSLTFHCQDTIEDEVEGESIQDFFAVGGDDKKEGGEEEEPSPPVEFDVSVARAGRTMRFSCTSEDARAAIDTIFIVPSDVGDGNNKDEMEEHYRGPALMDLPEDVKEKLGGFLREDCGVDGDVAAFVAMYADYREQVEYIRWLQGIQKIVSK